MNVVRLNKSVKRVVVLGESGPQTVYEKKDKKKLSKATKAAEARTRRWVKASMTAMQTYLDAHQKSNRKKKDGWLRDYSWNAGKAARKGVKRMRLLG
jgi:hypothetical protein